MAITWTDERQHLRALLGQQDPTLGELYAQAIEALGQAELTAARLGIGCHCIRELIACFPLVMGDPVQSRTDVNKPAKHLAAAWQEAGLTFEAPTKPLSGDDGVEPVPAEVYDAARQVAQAGSGGTEGARARNERIVTGPGLLLSSPELRRFHDAVDALTGMAHLRSYVGPSATLPKSDRVAEHLLVVENGLRSRLSYFGDQLAAVDAALTSANQRLDEADPWQAPADEAVDELLAVLINPQVRVRFFSQLANPKWLEPLRTRRQFEQSPPIVMGSDGAEQAAGWPEGDYLVRVAATAPETVSQLLQRHATNANPWVRRVIVEAATHLPASLAAKHVPAICAAINGGSPWVDPRPVVTLASELITAGQAAAGRRILTALFEPRPAEAGGGLRRGRAAAGLRDYWYDELLPSALPALQALGQPGLQLAARWLLRFLSIRGDRSTGGRDISYMWRPSIGPHQQNRKLYDLGDALIDAVVGIGQGLAADGNLRSVTDWLLARDEVLLTRIALYVAGLTAQSNGSAEVLAVGRDLLMVPGHMELTLRPEYTFLAGVIVPHLGDEDRRQWESAVLAGDWRSDEEYRRVAAWGSAPDVQVTDEQVADARQRGVYRLLAGLPRGVSDRLDARFTELSSELGPIENPNFVSFSTSFTGPNSPRTVPELAEMSADVLGDFLASWQASDGHGGEPSVEGLSRTLTEVAAEQPALVAEVGRRLRDGGKSYVRAAFTGWARAVKDGYVPTADVWQLAGEVAAEVDQDVDQPEPFEGHDLLWTSSQQACLGLVESVLQKEDVPLDEATARACYAVIEPLTRSLDPTAAHEAASENTDPLTLSLNSVRPIALRCLIQLGQRLMKEPVPPGLEAIIGLLDEHAGPAKDPSLAVAATIGEGLGKIATFAPEWFAAHAAELLGHLTDAAPERRHWSDAVLSVALRVYYPGTTFFGLMRPWLGRVLSDDYESLDHVEAWASAGRSTREEVGRHIVSAFLGGRLTLDDELLGDVFRPERPELAAEVLGIVGWSADGGGFSTDELARSRQLIEWRLAEIEAGRAQIEELRQFFWWVRSGQFDAAWWLPILRQIAAADPDFDPNGMVGDALAAAGEEHPADALAVLDALLVDPEQVRVYDLLQAAPSVLLSAFRLGDEVVQADAQQLLDRLGRQGNLDLVASVEEARRRLDGLRG